MRLEEAKEIIKSESLEDYNINLDHEIEAGEIVIVGKVRGNVFHQPQGLGFLIEQGAHEVGVHFDMALHSRIRHKGILAGAALPNLYALYIGGDGVKLREKARGFGVVVGGKDTVSAVNGRKGFGDGPQLVLIFSGKILGHGSFPPFSFLVSIVPAFAGKEKCGKCKDPKRFIRNLHKSSPGRFRSGDGACFIDCRRNQE